MAEPRSYYKDRALAALVRVTRETKHADFIPAVRADIEQELRNAVAVGQGHRIEMLRDALADIPVQ